LRVLVTGGAGYIGSFVVRRLREQGHSPVVLDRLSTGTRAAVPDTPLVVGDVRDAQTVSDLLERFDIQAAIHLAGAKSVEESTHDPGAYFDTNAFGTLVLARAMAARGLRHLVFSSSCAVYGEPEELPVTERSPTRPANPYGESKLFAERILARFDTAHALRTATLRYFNAAGAATDGSLGEDWSRATNLIPFVLKVALNDSGPVQVFGTDYPTPDGTAVRDYVHVVDLADAHLLALEHLIRNDRSLCVNLGTGRGASVREVIETARRVTGASLGWSESPRRRGDLPAIWADNRSARDLLGWRPRHGLDEIVATAWSWHRSHPNGLRDAAAAPGPPRTAKPRPRTAAPVAPGR
jgi:UDP-glucose-4-epimerase GalE